MSPGELVELLMYSLQDEDKCDSGVSWAVTQKAARKLIEAAYDAGAARLAEVEAENERLKGDLAKVRADRDTMIAVHDEVEAERGAAEKLLRDIQRAAHHAIDDCPVQHRGTGPYSQLHVIVRSIANALSPVKP